MRRRKINLVMTCRVTGTGYHGGAFYVDAVETEAALTLTGVSKTAQKHLTNPRFILATRDGKNVIFIDN